MLCTRRSSCNCDIVAQLRIVVLLDTALPGCYKSCWCLQALDVAKGMLALHAHTPPIIHCNLRPQALVVDEHMGIKVSGLTFAKLRGADEEERDSNTVGNVFWRWQAPEVILGNPATPQSVRA